MSRCCRIIGVLDNAEAGLTPQALQAIQEAQVVIGASRTLALLAGHISPRARQYDPGGRLTAVPEWINQAFDENRPVVVLATGDPLCHGIARFLVEKLGAERCEVIPNLSTIQLACARLKLSWQDMKICSVHSKDAGEWQGGAGPEHGLYALLKSAKEHPALAILTSPENTPARIARMLKEEGLAGHYRLSVVSKILQPGEQVVKALGIDEAATREFDEPNVAILQAVTRPSASTLFGLEDEVFQQRRPDKGLITKREVRAVSLAMMQLRRDSIVWDIGAGSGALGLEAARLCSDGHVYAIEKNEADYANAAANRQRLGISNYTLLHQKAPEGLQQWPDADAVFIGGSGGELPSLITLCLQRLRPKGVLVMNFVTLENLHAATQTLKELGAHWSLSQINVSRSRPILHMQRMIAENPVWVLSARPGGSNAK